MGGSLMSEKAPTVVLLNPDQSFNSFGYTAENEYSELAKLPGKKYRDYYYFNNFKMKLHVSKVRKFHVYLKLNFNIICVAWFEYYRGREAAPPPKTSIFYKWKKLLFFN
jgi:hypothetical protein